MKIVIYSCLWLKCLMQNLTTKTKLAPGPLSEVVPGKCLQNFGTLLLVGSRSRSKQSGGKKTKTADSITNFRFGQDLIKLKCKLEYT